LFFSFYSERKCIKAKRILDEATKDKFNLPTKKFHVKKQHLGGKYGQ
jgi:hypothetical protein